MGSDTYGFDDVEQGFNLTVGLHSLELIGEAPQLDVTAGYPTVVSTSVWPQIKLDGQSISPENTTDVIFDKDWIRFDQETRDITINPDDGLVGPVVPVSVAIKDAFGNQLSTELKVQVEAYAFNSDKTAPAVLGGKAFAGSGDEQTSEGDMDLSDYLAVEDIAAYSFEVFVNEGDIGQALRVEASDGALRLRGSFPETNDYQIVEVEVRAINTTSFAVSTLSFQLDLTKSQGDAEAATKSGGLSSGAQATLGAAVGIACLALILFLIYLLNKKRRNGDLSMCSSLSMRKSASLGPEMGMFQKGQRSEPYLTIDLTRDETKRDEDTYSARTLVESSVSQEEPSRLVPSSSSLVVRMSKSAGTFSRRMAQAVAFGARFNKRRLSKDMISDPIKQEDPIEDKDMSAFLRSAPWSDPSLPPLTREGLFVAARDIGKRDTTDSTSTVFTNFSHDTELWGKSDHEDESNFSQTPSHRRPRCLTGTSRSGGQVHFSPESAGASSPEASSNESPTPRPLYPRERFLNTINEDLCREGSAILSPLRNPFQRGESETSSLGTVQTASRAIFEAATPEQISVGSVRKTTYGSITLKEPTAEDAEHSFVGSIGQSERSTGSAERGDKGSILNQTSFEGFPATDSAVADADEIEHIASANPFGKMYTSIAAEHRKAHQLTGTIPQGQRMTSSRRTGSYSSMTPTTCNAST